MAILMITYDTEMYGREFGALQRWLGDRIDDPTITERWIDKAQEVHGRAHAPCTSYVVGRLIEQHVDGFRKLAKNPLFNVENHTYTHVALKPIVSQPPADFFQKFIAPYANPASTDEERGVTCGRQASIETIREQLVKTRVLIKQVCGTDSVGISGPGGYYRGMSDRLDILQVFTETGIKFSRCYARNEHDFSPVSFDAQPFWYKAQGYPDILELPANDWQDVFWRDIHGWTNLTGYLDHLKKGIDHIVERDLIWTYCTHEWSAIENDPEMTVIGGLIQYAQDRGVELMSQRAYYERRLAQKQRVA
jgi:peptidoglycan/xylan/chitin deacetylase (PgdA/CDA1 family)